ncbi:6-methylsalicylic acid synthase (mellein synthase) [Teratosphaeria destructans]|uniref:6-methylsalicylic acid synthase n=1 Tax=Teratosphaeria destructans TaxID=418781 RepID=A0A9W7T0G5_9PEZI|nr:6-methylsalicylic acid synthase (mellein synthase) [Teratosphaeria destructans]
MADLHLTPRPLNQGNVLPSEDVAIVGMACRTSGKVDSPEKLWQFLIDGKGVPGKEALEDAGIDPRSLAGSNTAVFMGIDSDDYSRLLLEDIPNIEAWMGIGTAAHGVPNRVSYHLDLMGPSAAVDAACASSLVAVHHGRQAILMRESRVAIVGGVNVLLAPALTRMLGKAGALSPDAICKSFDDAANGYARGEGGAVLVLKELSSAVRDGDKILATLKGSAVAQDGKTNGIMAPNAKAQEIVGRQALARAGIDPLTVGYVEAHATATPLGDPTEISAISALYGSERSRTGRPPVWLGSIKPNTGHLEAAAGTISLIKAVLAVDKGELAPQAHLNELTSKVDWHDCGLQVVRERTRWADSDGPRRAAVCSYGYGGTVSQAIIEQYPRANAYCNGSSSQHSRHDSALINGQGHQEAHLPIILAVSAIQEKRLGPQAKALAEWLASESGRSTEISIVGSTLAMRRAHHDYRLTVLAETHDEAITALLQSANGSQDKAPRFSKGRILQHASSVWVFSGHGAQWKDMGLDLLHDHVFVRAISDLDTIIHHEAGFSAVDVLGGGNFEASERVQIMTYVMQIGLSEVLKSRGVKPTAVIGHSVGEIAASVVAGCLTAAEGALVVIRRAKLYLKIREKHPGGMALVGMPFAEVVKKLGKRTDLVAAIDSSPTSSVISGTADAVSGFTDEMKQSGVRTFRVNTDVAFHSPMLAQLRDPLKDALTGSLHPRAPHIPVYSTSNRDCRHDGLRDVDYWIDNMINPVQLTAAVSAAIDDGHRIFVEVSSHPIVLQSINETISAGGLGDDEFATIPTMKRDVPASQALQSTVAQLYINGAPVDFDSQFGHKSEWSREVPRTQWMHRPYYRQVETGPLGAGDLHNVDKHTLLGQRTTVLGTDTVVYSTRLDDRSKPYPGMHPLDGTEIIPAAVYINTFQKATGANVLADIQLKIPVSMGPEPREVQIVVEKGSISVASTLPSSPDSDDPVAGEKSWIAHSVCHWQRAPHLNVPTQRFDIPMIQKRIGTLLPHGFAVDFLSKVGVASMAFPWTVTEHYGNEQEMLAKVDVDPSVDKVIWDDKSWAPMLDAATSVGSAIFFNKPSVRIVSRIDEVTLYTSGSLPKIGYLFIEAAPDSISLASHVSVLDESGTLLAKFKSMRFSEVEGASGMSGSTESLVHLINWVPPKFSEKPRRLSSVLLVSDDEDKLAAYHKQLESQASHIHRFRDATELEQLSTEDLRDELRQKGATIVYVPRLVERVGDVADATEDFIWQTSTLARFIENNSLSSTCKLFVITHREGGSGSVTALAHGALYGLARIIASEHPDLWGGLLDTDEPQRCPLTAMKYVQGQDVVRVVDGLPRRGVMRSLTAEERHSLGTAKTLMPKPQGTYVVTGGLGDFGLETCRFLVEKGARRIVTVSRTGLAPRRQWPDLLKKGGKMAAVIALIEKLEGVGASIHAIALDISAPDAAKQIRTAIEALGLPPILGVVHAAGILEGSLLMDTTRDFYAHILASKVRGALALHEAFPPKSLDFFVLYSSTGQLVGTVGQAAYGSANAFLDGLAAHRRSQGDNAVSFQFSALRGLGMATGIDFLAEELLSKGITDISRDEAFRAWEHVNKYDIDSAVVVRCLPIEEGSVAPIPLIEDVVVRRPRAHSTPNSGAVDDTAGAPHSRPADPVELEQWLSIRIRECIAAILMMSDVTDVDPKMSFADMGIDSVMTVALREKLQSNLRVKVPLTLTWNKPTVNHLIPWFVAKFEEGGEK